MYVDRKEDLEAERAMRAGLRAPWGANVPKVAIPDWPDVTFRVDGPFLVALARLGRGVIADAVEHARSFDPRQELRRRLEWRVESGLRGELV